MILFKTVHGSRLYNLAKPTSDYDYYVVVDKVKTRKASYATQSIVDNVDTTMVDFGTWMKHCQSGVPQALEAMFSQQAEIDRLAEFRNAFRVGNGIRDKYYRTIKAFLAVQDVKKNKHGLRLSINLHDALRYQRFNPTLSVADARWVNLMANALSIEDLRYLADITIHARVPVSSYK